MAEPKSVRLERPHLDAFDQMVEEGDADNESEAHRSAVNAGLAALGYEAGVKQDTRLRSLTQRFADAFALLGVMWLGASIWLPIEFRIWAVGPFAMSAACLALDRVLEAHEPAVTHRIRGALGREDGVA